MNIPASKILCVVSTFLSWCSLLKAAFHHTQALGAGAIFRF